MSLVLERDVLGKSAPVCNNFRCNVSVFLLEKFRGKFENLCLSSLVSSSTPWKLLVSDVMSLLLFTVDFLLFNKDLRKGLKYLNPFDYCFPYMDPRHHLPTPPPEAIILALHSSQKILWERKQNEKIFRLKRRIQFLYGSTTVITMHNDLHLRFFRIVDLLLIDTDRIFVDARWRET